MKISEVANRRNVEAGDSRTRDRIVAEILQSGGLTAVELATRLNLTAAGIRRHLDQLQADDLISIRQPRLTEVKGRGRPAKVFVLTDSGHNEFDQQYDRLAIDALRFLQANGGDDAVAAFAKQRVEFIERDYAEVAAANPEASPAQVLAMVLSQEGYAAKVAVLPVGEQLCQQHCPVSHVAQEFPELCAAETEAISNVLGHHVQRLATIAHGDGVCTTCIPTRKVVQ